MMYLVTLTKQQLEMIFFALTDDGVEWERDDSLHEVELLDLIALISYEMNGGRES